LTPLGKVARGKRRWLLNVTAYTVAGLGTSGLTGSTVGLIGAVVVPERLRSLGLGVALCLAVIGIARGLGWMSFRVPRVTRQTRDTWAKDFGDTTAATLWGLDLGLTVTTRFPFSGVSLLLALAFVAGDPVAGAALFWAFWLGRVASVWIGPLLLEKANATDALLDSIDSEQRTFARINIAALACSIVVLTALTGSTIPS
jgi:Cytochrome C biogenesis protein transmembrane region